MTSSLPSFKTARVQTMEKSASSSSLQLERNIRREADWDSQSAVDGVAELEAVDAARVSPERGHQRTEEQTTSPAAALSGCSTSTVTHGGLQPETGEENARTSTALKDSNTHPRGSPNAHLNRKSPVLSTYLKCKQLLLRLLIILKHLMSFILYMVREGFPATRPKTSSELLRKLQRTAPMTNALLSLAKEASRRNCPQLWATNETTQIAILTLVGGGTERFLQKELHELLDNEETWCRSLYHLRHTLWPGGVFDRSPRKQKSEEKKAELKREAAEAFKQFLPSKRYCAEDFAVQENVS